MRLIKPLKFRIWSNELGTWVTDLFLENLIDIDKFTTLNDLFNDIQKNECLVIQQFTGLKDKGNKEIYEGDIIKTDPDHFAKCDVHWVEYTKGVVTWLREAFCVCQPYVGGNEISHYVCCNCCPCGLEVIGNIFENLELLDRVPAPI
jgi:uncharacterized phage protein (TIGR01671 family)